jgi:transcription elongation GreA/GreB family factor
MGDKNKSLLVGPIPKEAIYLSPNSPLGNALRNSYVKDTVEYSVSGVLKEVTILKITKVSKK